LPVNPALKQTTFSPGLIIQAQQLEKPNSHINVTIINNNHYYLNETSAALSSPKGQPR
jgi:hypothetical protein